MTHNKTRLADLCAARHVLSNMQMTSLPPTWSAVEAVQPVVKVDGGQDSPHRAPSAADCLDAPRLEYVNCVTGERTSQHPGARYFRGVVDEERKLQRGVRQGRPVSGSSTVRSARQLPRGVVVTTRGTLPQESPVTPTKKANRYVNKFKLRVSHEYCVYFQCLLGLKIVGPDSVHETNNNIPGKI